MWNPDGTILFFISIFAAWLLVVGPLIAWIAAHVAGKRRLSYLCGAGLTAAVLGVSLVSDLALDAGYFGEIVATVVEATMIFFAGFVCFRAAAALSNGRAAMAAAMITVLYSTMASGTMALLRIDDDLSPNVREALAKQPSHLSLGERMFFKHFGIDLVERVDLNAVCRLVEDPVDWVTGVSLSSSHSSPWDFDLGLHILRGTAVDRIDKLDLKLPADIVLLEEIHEKSNEAMRAYEAASSVVLDAEAFDPMRVTPLRAPLMFLRLNKIELAHALTTMERGDPSNAHDMVVAELRWARTLASKPETLLGNRVAWMNLAHSLETYDRLLDVLPLEQSAPWSKATLADMRLMEIDLITSIALEYRSVHHSKNGRLADRSVCKPNMSLNKAFAAHASMMTRLSLPPDKLVRAAPRPQSVPTTTFERLRNTFGELMCSGPLGILLSEPNAVLRYDTETLLRLVWLKQQLRELALPDEAIPKFLARQKEGLRDLYNPGPFTWDSSTRRILSTRPGPGTPRTLSVRLR